MMRRRVGRPLLRTAAVGAAGYAVGSSAANRAEAERQQDAQIADLQQQQAAMAQPAYAPPQQSYAPPPAYAPPPPPPAYQMAAPELAAPPTPAPDPIAMLKQLGELKAAGVISQDEFDVKKAELLKQI